MDALPQVTEVFFHVADSSNRKEEAVRISRPDILRRRSLKLRELIDEAAAQQNQKITLVPDCEFGIDRPAVEYVLENLQHDAAQSGGDCQLEALARHCAVLWQYNCIPDPFATVWYHTQPQSSQSSTPSVDQRSNGSKLETTRGWRRKRSIVTCGHLIIVGFVLGLRSILEDEIKVAVWGSNKDIITTVIPFNLKSTRQEELGKLFNKLYEELNENEEQNSKLVKQIRKALRENSLGDFSNMQKRNSRILENRTPYDFLRGVENVMMGLQEPSASAQKTTSSNSQATGKSVPPINLANLFDKFKKTVINGIEPKKEIIGKILDNLESFIEGERKKLASALMVARNETIEGWRAQLDRLET